MTLLPSEECLARIAEVLEARVGAIYWRTLAHKPFTCVALHGCDEHGWPPLQGARLAALEEKEFVTAPWSGPGDGFYLGCRLVEAEFELVAEVIQSGSGPPAPERIDAFRGLLPDYFPRLRAQALSEALARQRNLTRAMLEEVVDGIMTLDSEGRVVVFNRAAEQITGYQVSELRGQDPDEVLRTSESLIASPGEWRELRLTTKAGWERIVRLHIRRPSGESHFPDFAWVAVFRDVSRQKELERIRLDFTTTLSHELRTPLAGVKGYLHTLMHRKAREYPPEKVQSTLAIINHQVDRLAKLIDDLLEAARLGNQALEVNPRTVDLAPVLNSTLRGYRESEPDYQLRLSCPESLVCRCDAEQLVYVLNHLLSNAVKYSVPGGLIELTGHLRGDELRISVRDQGVGIPIDQQEHIFEMYHRVCNEDSRTHYGMGIGLYLARKVIDAHGGRLQVESAPGCGSTFTIAVPQHPGE